MTKYVVTALAVVALAFPVSAAAWEPEDCPTPMTHPHCVEFFPPENLGPETTPPVVTAPVAPPVVTPPATPPEVVTPPETVPETTVLEEEATPEAPAKDEKVPQKNTGGKVEVRKAPTDTVTRSERLGVPTQVVNATDNVGLPYTGLPAGWLALIGAGLAATGFAARRLLAA